MNTLSIRISDTPKEAPCYKSGDFKRAILKEAVIVGKGMENGKATVDLVFEVMGDTGETSEFAVAITSGNIIKALAATIQGVEER